MTDYRRVSGTARIGLVCGSLSVRPSHSAVAAGLLLWARQAKTSTNRWLLNGRRAVGECGQCHVIAVDSSWIKTCTKERKEQERKEVENKRKKVLKRQKGMKIGHMLQRNRATPHGWRKLAKTRKKYSLSRVPSATFELFFARYFFTIFSLYIYI